MFKFLKSFTGIALVALLGYGLYSLATKNANDSIKTLHVAADNTTTIVGTVLINKHDCLEQDTRTQCFLKLSVRGKEIYVIYNTNDNSFCPNESTAASGKTVREGSAVKVHGFYRKSGNLDTVLTCPTKDYYIQTL